MKVIKKTQNMQEIANDARSSHKTIGFVPTMGYLHEGHLSLVDAIRKRCDLLVMSIFVNPTQFGPGEDFDRYPRDIDRDSELAEKRGVDILFTPDSKDIYPDGFQTFVEVTEITQGLCGQRRPGHFKGVTTIVTILFNIVKPHLAAFGMKDFQQLRTIQRMVNDLKMDIEIVECPIVREPDGLAMSSRNIYLNREQRQKALCLYQSLCKIKQLHDSGLTEVKRLIEEGRKVIEKTEGVKLDYLEIRDKITLKEIDLSKNGVALGAIFVDNVRLIDNIILD